jgi:anti-anti-sigma factor
MEKFCGNSSNPLLLWIEQFYTTISLLHLTISAIVHIYCNTMELALRENNGIPVIDVKGEITMYDVGPINNSVANLTLEKKYHIVLNMEEVKFIDSSGVGVIIRSILLLNKFHGVMHICNCKGSVLNIISVSLKNTKTRVFPTEEEAVNECLKVKTA